MKPLLMARGMALVFFCFIGSQLVSQDIFEAVRTGDVDKTKAFLKADPDLLDRRGPDLLTPLNLAAASNQPAVAAFLLESGADPAVGDRENSQPIHLAAVSGSVPILKLLISKGVDKDTRDINGMTPLLFAVSRGQVEAVQYLVSAGADVKAQSINGFTALHLASISGSTELIELFLEKGARVNTRTDQGYTPLHSAASYGRTEAVKVLIENGADLLAENESGERPLALAVGPRSADAATYLLSQGSEVDHRSTNGFTALHFAAMRGSLPVMRVLIDHGADVNAASNEGLVPLSFVAWTDQPLDAARFLILHGADVNPDPCSHNKACTCGPTFRTPLHAACMMGSLELAELLVSNGAKVNIYSDIGFTPLHYAVRSGNEELVSYLVGHGAFLNTEVAGEGVTELHLAASMGYGDIARVLVTHGSSCEMRDCNGNCPVELALQHGQKEIAKAMVAAGADDTWLKAYLEKECPVSKPVAEGEARVWFLGHSGWAVKTTNHLLVFDYFEDERSRQPDHLCLAAGCVKPEELKDLKVTVFSSHDHADHFSPAIFNWKESIPDIDYVLCWEPAGIEEEYTLVPVHGQAKVDGMDVYVNYSTDLGGGYLVEVDGLVIFHMGDHANGEDQLMAEYTREIDMVEAKKKDIDILFGPIRGCSLGTPEQVRKGTYYTLEKLHPALFVPMHSGNHSYEYKAFAEQAQRDGLDQEMMYVTGKGDMFEYRSGQAVD